jgi:hypothetical protein
MMFGSEEGGYGQSSSQVDAEGNRCDPLCLGRDYGLPSGSDYAPKGYLCCSSSVRGKVFDEVSHDGFCR